MMNIFTDQSLLLPAIYIIVHTAILMIMIISYDVDYLCLHVHVNKNANSDVFYSTLVYIDGVLKLI